jgi:hypothetical protein
MKPPPKPPPYKSVFEQLPDHTKAIGMTSIEIANLDFILGYFFGALLGIEQDAGYSIYLEPKSATARLDLLKATIKAMYPEDKDKDNHKHFMSLCALARTVVTNRDRLIHDCWGVNPEGRPVRRKDREKTIPVDINDLNKSIDDIRLLIGDVRLATDWLEKFARKRK